GARDGGLDVTFDCYPYTWASTRLLIVVPDWAQDGGPDQLKAVLRSPEGRQRLVDEIGPFGPSYQEMFLTYFKQQHNHKYEGCSMAEVAEMMGKNEVEAMCDLLLDEDLQVSYVAPGAYGVTLPKFLAHPLSMVGSDSLLIGEFPSPRTYGCFANMLGEVVREERLVTIQDAVRKMTSFPAQRLGLPDRGLLRDGFKADIVVFDPRTVKSPATRRNPKQFPVGIDHVVVNGKVVVEDAQHTGVLAGRALRRGRART